MTSQTTATFGKKIPSLLQWWNSRRPNFTYIFILNVNHSTSLKYTQCSVLQRNILDIKIVIWLLAKVGSYWRVKMANYFIKYSWSSRTTDMETYKWHTDKGHICSNKEWQILRGIIRCVLLDISKKLQESNCNGIPIQTIEMYTWTDSFLLNFCTVTWCFSWWCVSASSDSETNNLHVNSYQHTQNANESMLSWRWSGTHTYARTSAACTDAACAAAHTLTHTHTNTHTNDKTVRIRCSCERRNLLVWQLNTWIHGLNRSENCPLYLFLVLEWYMEKNG